VALALLWIWAKKVHLNPDELLLAQNERGETALHLAADGNHGEIIQELWVWAKEAQLKPNE
jgi:hypothetical protein